MMDQWMLLSLPSSGSDWLCRLIAEHCPTLRYWDKEFFNPICNRTFQHELRQAFGCEMPSFLSRITADVDKQTLERVYSRTWQVAAAGRYTFDKEVFAFCRLPFFAPRFQTAVLHRGESETFPPQRLRVWAWYDAIAASLERTGIELQRCRSFEDRCRLAHRIASHRLLCDANRHQVPVIHYRYLMRADRQELEQMLRPWLQDHLTADLLEAIEQTRVVTHRPDTKNSVLHNSACVGHTMPPVLQSGHQIELEH